VVLQTFQGTAEGAELVIVMVVMVIAPRLAGLNPLLTGFDAEVVIVLLGN